MLKAFGIVVLCLSLVTLVIWSQISNIRIWLDPDFIRLELKGKLLHQKIDVYCRREGASDSTLVYQSGKQLIKSFGGRGNNTFSVIYDNEIVGSVEHFKTDENNTHTYIYTLEEHSGQIDLVDVGISGKDGHQ